MAEATIVLPRLHKYQCKVMDEARRFNVLVCGRRWGKTTLSSYELLAEYAVVKGLPVAYCEPSYPMMQDVFNTVCKAFRPAIKQVNRAFYKITLKNGAVIDFWSLSNPDTIRGHAYGLVIIDEAGFCSNLQQVWEEIFRPSLVDLKGVAWFIGTPKGANYFKTLFTRGQSEEDEYKEWKSWQMPSSCNPHLPKSEIAHSEKELPEMTFKQEFLAEFLEDSGAVFRFVTQAVMPGSIGILPEPGRAYACGVDLARYQDFTVVTVLDDQGKQVYHDRYNLISWGRQVASIVEVVRMFNCKLCVDATGIGDAVVEQIKAALFALPSRDRCRIPDMEAIWLTNNTKGAMIENLAKDIESGRLQLMDVRQQTDELLAYAYERTTAGNLRMNAPEGVHDDCVIALALANHARKQTRATTYIPQEKVPYNSAAALMARYKTRGVNAK